ncbi:HflBKC-binding inner membrane protein [Thalassoglobus neptunius]|uniref:HflBKC-binding inner membrane protein n=1 Tax=Thalassoglobus neptunius TaxID=1938619 RepID=A0A5C5X7F8_9PLAN|nr:Bax inhibitor-1 family protein [Thalassoglobus neptunius]TWT58718.1 HflBKC-binding inner membrane protein [Thalassoglobus neptunius]
MSYSPDFGYEDHFVADARQEERVSFIRKTYAHVAGAVALFIALTAIMVNTPSIVEPLANIAFGNWWLVLIAFFIASTAAHRMAASPANPGLQYMGLGLYAFAEAILFAPMIWLIRTHMQGGDQIIVQAALFTLMIFGGLTAFVMITKTDFSFLRGILSLAFWAVLALIVVHFLTGFTLGTWFAMGMVVLMSGFILWETSNVLHVYRTDQYVAASLAIFSSLATLFWYVLQLTASMED